MTTTNEQSLETTNDAQLPALASGASPRQDGPDSQEAPAIVQDSAVQDSTPSQTQDERHNSSVTPDEPPVDPQVAALLGMFPDFDQSLLQSVLQSVSGDQERAIDVLLGMSDPEYKPTTHPELTQTELDEQFARRLLQEESEQQRSWAPHVAPAPAPYLRQTQLPETNNRPRAAENESMAQIQEQLGKFAETGKRTFNTLFSKVKAKIQEFDNPPQQGNASGSGNPLPHGDFRSTPAQAQLYYDPNPPQSFQGYDVTVQEPQNGAHMGQDVTTGTVNPAASATTTANNTPAPAGNVDRSKIGLLPKRPVSLGSSAQPSKSADEDDVEYVENPFEDGGRR